MSLDSQLDILTNNIYTYIIDFYKIIKVTCSRSSVQM